jgi:hypothetical protein
MRQLAIESKPVGVHYRVMSTNWIPRLGGRLARVFSWQMPITYADHLDRDAERLATELELIRIRFPHHA